jgi:hypothetical protein
MPVAILWWDNNFGTQKNLKMEQKIPTTRSLIDKRNKRSLDYDHQRMPARNPGVLSPHVDNHGWEQTGSGDYDIGL